LWRVARRTAASGARTLARSLNCRGKNDRLVVRAEFDGLLTRMAW
jgi:hypothetical protein